MVSDGYLLNANYTARPQQVGQFEWAACVGADLGLEAGTQGVEGDVVEHSALLVYGVRREK